MSSDVVVSAKNLGKAFALGDGPWRRLADAALRRGPADPFWALRDVDLVVRRGECVGVIGRNGAGKSTLMELICGVLRPSAGAVETRGRIAALLQLGIGFNPDFTGRENVGLAAAALGLTAREIADRFPAIEAFAEIGSFIDQPVRAYSSGMVARLAFAVCAHAEPDILVVDEILGVGDVRFQQKAMRFLRGFRRRGVLLFVSHNEHSVAALCDRAIWLDEGRIAGQGPSGAVLAAYRRHVARLMRKGSGFQASGDVEASATTHASAGAFDPDDPPPPAAGGRIVDVLLSSPCGALGDLRGGEVMRLETAFGLDAPMGPVTLAFALRNARGQAVLGECTELAEGGPGLWRCAFRFALPYLPSGGYAVDVMLLAQIGGQFKTLDLREGAALFQVASTHVSGGMANVRMDRAEIVVMDGAVPHG